MNQHEDISAWMDGAADPGRDRQIGDQVLDTAEARARWNEWHLIGDVMRSNSLAQPSSLTDKVARRLASEPVHLSRSRSVVVPERRVVRRKPLVYGAAVAAAVAFVTLVAVAPQMHQGGVGELLAGALAPPAAQSGRQPVEPFSPLVAEDPRLRDMLDAHGSMSIRPVSVEIR